MSDDQSDDDAGRLRPGQVVLIAIGVFGLVALTAAGIAAWMLRRAVSDAMTDFD